MVWNEVDGTLSRDILVRLVTKSNRKYDFFKQKDTNSANDRVRLKAG